MTRNGEFCRFFVTLSKSIVIGAQCFAVTHEKKGVMTRGNRRRGVNLGPRDPSLSYTNSVWNCAKELAGGS